MIRNYKKKTFEKHESIHISSNKYVRTRTIYNAGWVIENFILFLIYLLWGGGGGCTASYLGNDIK